MTMQELATAVSYDVPVVVCILNNGYLGMVRQWQDLFWNKRYSFTCIEVQPDFKLLAEAFGAVGMRSPRRTRSSRRCARPSPAAGRRSSTSRPRPRRTCTRWSRPAGDHRDDRRPVAQREEEAVKHTLSVLVENKPGVLTRVAGLFARRGFNIESLAVGLSEDPRLSRITIIIDGDEHPIDQVTKQLHKLINVVKIRDLEPGSHGGRRAAARARHRRGREAHRGAADRRDLQGQDRRRRPPRSSRCAWSAPTTSSRRCSSCCSRSACSRSCAPAPSPSGAGGARPGALRYAERRVGASPAGASGTADAACEVGVTPELRGQGAGLFRDRRSSAPRRGRRRRWRNAAVDACERPARASARALRSSALGRRTIRERGHASRLLRSAASGPLAGSRPRRLRSLRRGRGACRSVGDLRHRPGSIAERRDRAHASAGRVPRRAGGTRTDARLGRRSRLRRQGHWDRAWSTRQRRLRLATSSTSRPTRRMAATAAT